MPVLCLKNFTDKVFKKLFLQKPKISRKQAQQSNVAEKLVSQYKKIIAQCQRVFSKTHSFCLFGISALLIVSFISLILWHLVLVTPLENEKNIVIASGSSGAKIALQLTQENVIENPLIFRIMIKFMGKAGQLHAGEYQFSAHISMYSVLQKLIHGKVLLRRITLVEGNTVQQIINLLNENPYLSGKISKIPIEGELLPQTYDFTFGTKREALLLRMQQAMDEKLHALWQARDPNLLLETPQQALILASIVERETGINAERERVASVFYNRLRNGWPLQTDPTLIYWESKKLGVLGRSLRRSDLQRHHPYNTYKNLGLPPTPIANPGEKAIYATLHPLQSQDFYFVADGTGGHAFAKTLLQHNKNVTKWRKIEKTRQNQTQSKKQK